MTDGALPAAGRSRRAEGRRVAIGKRPRRPLDPEDRGGPSSLRLTGDPDPAWDAPQPPRLLRPIATGRDRERWHAMRRRLALWLFGLLALLAWVLAFVEALANFGVRLRGTG